MPLSDGRRAFLESSKDELAKEIKADTLYDELIEAGVINEEKKKELKVSGGLVGPGGDSSVKCPDVCVGGLKMHP